LIEASSSPSPGFRCAIDLLHLSAHWTPTSRVIVNGIDITEGGTSTVSPQSDRLIFSS